jgi:predicted transcriptional regulator of viral defense system
MNPFSVGSSLVSPYYFSYATANAHYGFTAQMPSTYYIATTRKRPYLEWRNMGFRFVTLTSGKFFGFRQEVVLGAKVNMAEPEKAIVDSVDKVRYAGGIEEVVSVIYRSWGRVDKKKLVKYALMMRTHSICQRLGFLVDFLAARGLVEFQSNLRSELLKGVGRAPIYLAPSGSRRGSFSGEWRVVKNLEDRQLLSEVQPI